MLQKLLLLAICNLLLSGQGISARAEQEVLRITGSTTVYPLTRRIARKFQKLHPEVEVIVTGGGSVQGISALLDGSADIANSSRFISREELSRAFSSGTYPVPFRIADDCILPIRVNGVMGSIYSVRNGSYLINRPLFMFTRGWPQGRALQFINYATDPDRGQMIIEEMGFVSLYSHRHNH